MPSCLSYCQLVCSRFSGYELWSRILSTQRTPCVIACVHAICALRSRPWFYCGMVYVGNVIDCRHRSDMHRSPLYLNGQKFLFLGACFHGMKCKLTLMTLCSVLLTPATLTQSYKTWPQRALPDPLSTDMSFSGQYVCTVTDATQHRHACSPMFLP